MYNVRLVLQGNNVSTHTARTYLDAILMARSFSEEGGVKLANIVGPSGLISRYINGRVHGLREPLPKGIA